ncbi:hypothetical protein Asppvi_006030 [Aspergillus pseudoviridinutans]|uniref:Uncharacterized protein n=1 Tax=Aspergillus pseudoviridinutans TaxID=1517512 RepID=A0A9P3BG55_9EURO|nr:uncharacterized protein Asppvi_006030 [Aspergillus pseudoviridinutans]GIJ87126.1 hypothetical protein Asppvi_006030 [Aspergillus pseudoviridinutans]
MAATTPSSSSTDTTTPWGAPSSTTSSSALPSQEPTTPALTSAAATSSSISAVLTTTSTPSSHSTPSQITSVTPSSISLSSSSTVANATASSTASAHSTQSSLPTPSPSNVSTGALAGAIVGSIIGTAALTILGAFLFFRRRRKGAGAGRSEQYPEEKPPQHPPLPLGASASSHYTPQPADDETVRARILTLFDHASLHVDNYYSSGASSNPHDSTTSLASYESPYLPSPIATLLAKPGRQRGVLTHVLVRELLQQITPRPGKGGLLPACYAACPQIANQTPETDQVLFKWRMLTAYLYQHQQAARDVDDHAIDRLAERFVDTFAGYANPAHTRAERVQHLKSVASAAAELGRWLFAQPCAFEFLWDYPGKQGMVITPRVVKICDEQGRRLSVPQVMAQGTSL